MKTLCVSIALAIILLCSIGIGTAEQLTVTIQDPADSVQVAHRQEIKGKVSDPNADVWIVIHPIESSGFWVQPPVTVKDDGSWRVVVYFGEEGSKHVGTRFEVRAFANPIGNIAEGKTTQWPKATAKSNVIEVTRK